MAIYILTDSTADFLPDEAQRRGIWVVPLKVQFGSETYADGLELDHAAFFRKLETAKELPTTSQAGPDDFLPWFERVKSQGDSLICLPLAASLSGTYQSAVIAKQLCGYEHIHVVDSTQTVLGLRLLVDLACLLRDQGLDAPAIAQKLERAKHHVRLLAVVDTLKYLHKGRRVHRRRAFAGEAADLSAGRTAGSGRQGRGGQGQPGRPGKAAGTRAEPGRAPARLLRLYRRRHDMPGAHRPDRADLWPPPL